MDLHVCQAVRNQQGRFLCCCASNRDITTRKTTEEQLRESHSELLKLKEQLEAKNREMESVIGVVSHDLRTPLVSIQGFSGEIRLNSRDLIEKLAALPVPGSETAAMQRILTEEIPECLGYIDTSVKAMDQLVRSLVKVARAGMVKPNLEKLDMNELISQIVASVQYRIKTSKVQMDIDPLPECVADREQMTQVFTNLIDNAIKYISPDRQGRIHIWAKRQEDRCLYCVEDNGIGIPADSQQKIFSLFARLRFEQVDGEGIGLAVVKRMLDRNNGTIYVE